MDGSAQVDLSGPNANGLWANARRNRLFITRKCYRAMKISNKKRKYIRRNAHLKRPEELAGELGIPLRHVNKIMNKSREAESAGDKGLLSSIAYWIIVVVLLLAPLAVHNDLYDYSRLPKTAVIQIGAAAVLFAWLLANRSTRFVLDFSKYRYFLPPLLVLLWSLLSFIWAINRYSSFTLFAHWVACGVFCFVAFHELSTERRIVAVFYTLCVASALVSAIGLLQHYFGIDWIAQRAAPASTFGNKNMAAQFVGLCIPAAIAVFILARNKAAVWFSATSLSLMVIYLFHTHTKAVWLSVAGQILVFLTLAIANKVLKKPAVKAHKIPAAAAATVAIFVLINLTGSGWSWEVKSALEKLQSVSAAVTQKPPATAQGNGEGTQPIENDYRRDSAGARLIIWRNSLKLIKMHPFAGIGLNNFGAHYARTAIGSKKDSMLEFNHGPRNAHNDYLQIAAELGLPAVILFAWFGISVWICANIIFRSKANRTTKIFAIACLAAFVDLAINSSASFPLYRALPPLITAVYLAVYFRIYVDSVNNAAAADAAEHRTVSIGRLATAMTVMSFVLLAAWTTVQARWIAADRFSKLRAAAMSARNWNATVHWSKQVVQTNPHRPDVRHALGRAYFELKDYSSAKSFLLDYRRTYPHDTHNLFFLGKTYEMLGDYASAEKEILHVLSILPNHAASHDALGKIYGRQGRHEQAMREFRLATQLAPNTAEFFINRGAEAYKGRIYEDAVRLFEKAVELEPQSATARKNLGITLIRHMGRTAEGVQHLREALELDPKMDGSETIRQIVIEYDSNNR